MAAPVAGLFATLGLDDGPWAAGLRRASQQARDFQSQQERSFRSVAAATDGFGRSMRGALGGVAQQVQDVAVQFQSGTSAAVIFAQQGPQILGAFGPVGATIGALAGVTAVAAGAMLGYGREVDTAKAASDALETATHGLGGTIAGSADSVADLTGKYRALSDEMRTIERLSLGKKIRENEEALVSIRDQIAASVQAAKDSGQLALLQQSEALAKLDKGAVRDPGTAQLQQFLEGLDTALSRSAKGGLTEFADQVDRLVTGLPEAGSDARKLADSFIAPAEGAIKAANSIKQAQAALDGLAGKPIDSKGGDPFAGFKDAPKELERVREDIQRGLDGIAKTVAEKKRVVDREFAETFAAIGKQRSVPGADQHLLDEVEAQAKKLHAARLSRIDEEAAKEAENERKRGESARKRTDAIAREIEQNQRLIDAGKQGADAYEVMRRIIEAENKAIAAGLDPKGREAALLAEQSRALDEQAEARKRNAEAERDRLKAIEQTFQYELKTIGGLLDPKEDKEAERSVENLQRNLQTNVASALERGFEDGFGSVGDLVDQFGSLLKSTVATSLADSLISESLAKSISGALGTKIGEAIPSLAGTGAGEATVGGAATAGLGAALGGYAIGQSSGGNRVLGVGGGAAAGALAGGVYGSVVPGIGTAVGAGIGALIGGLAGYFGSGQGGGTRNNNYTGGYDVATGLPVEFQNTKPDPQNQSAVASVLAELAALREGLRATGVAFGDIGDLVIQAGNRTGLTLNGEKYGSQSALTEAALRQLLTGAEGLTADQQTVLEHSQATTAQGLLTDLSIPEQLQNLREPMSTFATGLKDLTRVYAEANDNAVRLHLSTEGLADAEARDRQRLVEAYKAELGLISPLQQQVANINDQWDQARRDAEALGLSERQLRAARADALAATRNAALAQLGFISPLQQQIMAIKEAFEEAAKSAEFLGKSEAELAQQRDRLIREALDQQRDALRSQVASAFSFLPDLQNFSSNAAISGAAGATKLDQFQALQAEYNRVFRLANRGDTGALGQIDDVGQQLLTLGREVYASGPQFAALQDRITGGIGDLAERFGRLQQDSFAALGDVFTSSIVQQTRALLDALRDLQAEQRAFRLTVERAERASLTRRNAA